MEAPELDWFRDLYRRIGEEWLWFSRLQMANAELAAMIQSPQVEIHALVHDGRDEGKMRRARNRLADEFTARDVAHKPDVKGEQLTPSLKSQNNKSAASRDVISCPP